MPIGKEDTTDQFEGGDAPGQRLLPAQPPNVWPPPPVNTHSGQGEQANTSGMHGSVPPEIARLRWNWGAFFLPWLWCVNHKLKWGWGILVVTALWVFGGSLGYVFGIVYFGCALCLGLEGYTLGWQNRRFDGGTAQYFDVQRKWLAWGVAAPVLLFAARALYFLVQFCAGIKDF